MHKTFCSRANELASSGIPFLFIIDFEMRQPLVLPLSEIKPSEIRYAIGGHTNEVNPQRLAGIALQAFPEPLETYEKKFTRVMSAIDRGESYLLNLTCRTKINLTVPLETLFSAATAPCKLWMRDRFITFSPEPFITIHDGLITTNPMKGTIDAALPDAAERILNDEKEAAEQVTVVDLLRNDLSIVASDVTVEKFRYLDKINAGERELLQVSSKITGRLRAGYENRLGEILIALLPAGSVSGAPKKRTLELIREIEGIDRGYYTGVFGICARGRLDSAVIIRYIEQTNDGFFYRSGGGITHLSSVTEEYHEMIEKIYVPVH
jgi:para-aminobenzoate synthetase component 1